MVRKISGIGFQPFYTPQLLGSAILEFLQPKGLAICIAQANGLGTQIKERRLGPTAQPFVTTINPKHTVHQSRSMHLKQHKMNPNLSERLRHLRSIRFVGQRVGPLARNGYCITNYPGRWPGLGKLQGLWPAATDLTCGVKKMASSLSS